MKNFSLIFFFFSLLVVSCSKKKNDSSTIDLGLSYYPIKIGKFVIYDVDSTIYTDLSKDTVIYKYRIKEKLAETFTDNLGHESFRLERYIKKFNASISYDSIPWQIKEVWTVSADDSKIQVVESNLRFTKLIFPIQANATWNGNALNSLGQQDYQFEYIDRNEIVGGLLLPNVLQVSQSDFRTLISYGFSVEKYAKDIGLVYREITKLESNTIVANTPVEDRIEQGFIYKQTLLTHGYE